MRFAGLLLYVGGLLAVGLGLLTRSKELVALAVIVGGLGYALRDYFSRSRDSVTVMTLYAAGCSFWFGLGNLAGYVLVDSAFTDFFYKFEVPEFLFEAQVLGALATFVPTLVYDAMGQLAKGGQLHVRLPRAGAPMEERPLVFWSIVLVAVDWAARFGGLVVQGLGTVSTLVDIGSNIGIFVLTFAWLDRPQPRRWQGLLLPGLVMLVSAGHSFLFDLLRMHMLFPVGAFFLPFVLRKAVDAKRAFVALAFVAAFIFVFEPLGQARRQAYGVGRLSAVASQVREGDPDFLDYGTAKFLARLSTFNQLSQIVSIAHSEGFYEGRTLDYLVYVFVPRIIWPEKPTIAPGRWFAEKLGRGLYVEGVGFSNAINMTIPGELYLNFGWLGTVLGMGLVGALYFLFWGAADGLRGSSNLLAEGFALVLINQALFAGSHFGAVVNIVIWYLVALFATSTITVFGGGRRAARAGVVSPLHAAARSQPSLPPRARG